MNLLLLSGASVRNKKWIEEVEDSCKSHFDKTYVQNYQHWDNQEMDFSLEIELNELRKLSFVNESYIVFAKSAGSILACSAISQGMLHPNRCIFAGFPLEMVKNYNLPADAWLSSVKNPMILLQNEFDPLGSYIEVASYITKVNNANITIHKLPGNTHDYKDIPKLKEFLIS